MKKLLLKPSKKTCQEAAAGILLSCLATVLAAGCSSAGKKPEVAQAEKNATESQPQAEEKTSNKEGEIPLIGGFKVNRFILDNGLRLLVVEDHSSPTLAYQTWFRVGSRDEVPSKTGLAHLFEHMMFKGTKTLKEGEFDRILESAGAEGENAFTNRDYTAYVQEMPSDKLDLIARLEADRMVNLIVNEQSFKTETQVVQNERRFRNENSPDGTMYQELFNIAFTKHPYHWPVIGYEQDLNAMSAKDAEEFYKAYYSPNHATVVIVGDVNPQEALKTVKRYYGSLEPRESLPKAIEPEPAQTQVRRSTLPLNIQVEKLMVAYHVPNATHEDIPAISLMQSVLTGGKSSRLYRALVETGIASGVDSYDVDDKDPTIFIITANMQKGKKATEAEAVIQREIKRLVSSPATEQELARARNKIDFSFYEGLDTNSEIARFLGHYEAVSGDFEAGIRNYKKIQDVKAEDVTRVAQKYLIPDGRTLIFGVMK